MKARGTERKLMFAARTQLVQWTDADAKAALAEGWGLFLTTANGIMRIGRIAKGPLVRFPHGRAAIAHVRPRRMSVPICIGARGSSTERRTMAERLRRCPAHCVRRARLETRLGGHKMTEKICPECNGEGVVDQDTEDERRCPTCNGSGTVPDDQQDCEEVWNTRRRLSIRN
jgi:hypothetical protein